jgi:hypothetical protein
MGTSSSSTKKGSTMSGQFLWEVFEASTSKDLDGGYARSLASAHAAVAEALAEHGPQRGHLGASIYGPAAGAFPPVLPLLWDSDGGAV